MTSGSERISVWRDRLITPLGALLIAAGVFAALWQARQRGLLFTPEMRLTDWLLLHRSPMPAKDNPCVIVHISERDIRDRLKQYPISDKQLAEVVERLASMQPRVIGLDIFRDIPTPDISGGFDSQLLDETLRKHRNVVGIFLVDADEDWVAPPQALAGPRSQRAGFNNVSEDADGRVRRVPLYLDDPKNLMQRDLPAGETLSPVEPAFALVLAGRFLRADGLNMSGIEGTDAVALGAARLTPFDRSFGPYASGDPAMDTPTGLQLVMDHRGPRRFERIDLTELFKADFDAHRIKDRLVIFGVLNKSVKDYLPTAVNPYTPGVEVHAMFADQLIRGARGQTPVNPRSWSNPLEALWIGAWCLVGGGVGLAGRSAWRFAVGVAAGIVGISTMCWAALHAGIWIPLLPSVLGLAATSGLAAAWVAFREWGDRQAWTALAGKLVSPAIARELWRSRRELFEAGRMRPRQMTATVLFFDLKGFTALAEKSDPAAMIGLLNEFFQEMATVVESGGGVVNKFVGDQILALFGPPLPRSTEAEFRQDATNAVVCGIALRRRLVELNERWSAAGRPRVYMRVGIYTGPLVAGSVGSRERLEYTVIGDTVNTASRLESIEKDLFDDQVAPGGCRIFIGQPTLERLDGQFCIRPVSVGEIKGKLQAIAVYAVLDEA